MKKRNKLVLILSIIAIVILSTVGIYLGTYYRASNKALEIAQQDGQEIQMNGNDVLLFTPEESLSAKPVLIFYPGGKVQMEAYAPLCDELSNRGITCVLVKMPFNLAVFKQNAAEGVIEYMSSEYNYENYYIGGHSLGGVMASYYAYSNPTKLKGIIFLASYPNKDLSSTDLKALSIYGSNDKVLDMDAYNKAIFHFPEQFTEAEIEGGCHSYFGSYGMQKGDGTPAISRNKQLSTTADIIEDWIQEE